MFVRNWYDEKGVPALTLSWARRDRGLRGTIVQRPARYSGPIDLALIGESNGQRSVVSVSIDGERTEFSFDVDFAVSSVQRR